MCDAARAHTPPRIENNFRGRVCRRYCGSCWAHGSVSALGDRIKIARGAKGVDINLSVQHMLNCIGMGSCHGGSLDGPYQWIHGLSKSGTGISYATSNPYMACSSESKEGHCAQGDWSCSALNVARTCGTFGAQTPRLPSPLPVAGRASADGAVWMTQVRHLR